MICFVVVFVVVVAVVLLFFANHNDPDSNETDFSVPQNKSNELWSI